MHNSEPSSTHDHSEQPGAVVDRQPEPGEKGLMHLFRTRTADMITFVRCILGLGLAGSALVSGSAVLPRDIWIMVLAWSGDIVDGPISRSLKVAGRSWFGKHDVYLDMSISGLLLAYLLLTGLLPWWAGLAYIVVWAVIFWRFGVPAELAQVFQNPIYLYFVIATVTRAPSVIPWLLLWMLVAAVIFRKRMMVLLRNFFKKASEN